MADRLTHLDDEGRARMVDVGDKPRSAREAIARARVLLNENTFRLVKDGALKKGDVLTVAEIAGVLAAKRTAELIPLCHPLALTFAGVRLTLDDAAHAVDIETTCRTIGETGVEMEALTAASVAALTVYDMCKAVQKDIRISDVHLVKKTKS